MDKTDVIRKYAVHLGLQPYYTAGQAQIFLKKDGYCFVTDPETDFRQFEYACISDCTELADPHKDILMAAGDLEALVVARTPYAGICAASGREICASLDDMAQIIGRKVIAVGGSVRSVQKALRKAGAVMVSGDDPYVITAGRTLSEACVALDILEKSAEVNLKASVIGGRKPLGAVDCRLMRAVYRRKYSRPSLEQEQIGQVAPEHGAGPENDGSTLPWKEAAEALVKYGRMLAEKGLVQGTWGNLSVRLDEEYMLCTPSGIDYERLRPSDMVRVRIADLHYEGEQKPTSEKGLHAGIYRTRPEARAVLHTHSKNCSVFAAAEMPLQVEEEESRSKIGELIKVARYALPGTRKLTSRTLDALGNGSGAIMAHHGMVCHGSDLEDAFQKCCLIEEAAMEAIDRRMK